MLIIELIFKCLTPKNIQAVNGLFYFNICQNLRFKNLD
jgi:hypothetical protein